MLSTPEFWVAVSFVMFVGLLIYLGVPGKITAALDARADRIANELAEANRLREEAQAVKEVQSAASDLAIAAASHLIAGETKGTKGAKLVDDSIAALKRQLN